MRNYFVFFIRHFVFWFAFFLLFRIAFILLSTTLPENVSLIEIITGLYKGMRLDWSIASYVFVLPLLMTLFWTQKNQLQVTGLMKWYFRTIILLLSLSSIANIIIFKFWGTLLNNRALAYLTQPGEAMASASNTDLMIYFFVLIIVIWFFIRMGDKVFVDFMSKISMLPLPRVAAFLIALPLVVVGIRGGLQLIPINESSAVYSPVHQLNQMAINHVWYLGHNLHQSGFEEENLYVFMSEEEAETRTKTYLKKSESDTTEIFNIRQKPNVVIILLESWTADIIEPLEGEKGVTPAFSELAKEGLLFTSVYSSGFRTDQALVSALSGFPSQPNKSIIRFPSKAIKLPSLARTLKSDGYTSSFYYGGETGFANMNTYLINSGYDKTISIDDFGSDKMNSKWGAHDEFVFNKLLEDLKTHPIPFFATVLTLSTHEPFEVPVATPFDQGQDESEKFRKSAWYTDKCLEDFFTQAKKQDWYSNTIFVLMADHGHRLPLNREYFDPQSRRIPLLITGAPLKNEFKGKKIDAIANQHDLPATLLKSLGLSDQEFNWSVNILDPERKNYAYLSQDMAISFLTSSGNCLLPLQSGIPAVGESSENFKDAKAFLQQLYGEFVGY